MLPPSSMTATKRMNRMRAAIDVVERKMLKDSEDIYDRRPISADEIKNLRIGDKANTIVSMNVQIVSIDGESETVDVDIIDRGNGSVFGRLCNVPIDAISPICEAI